ncbi:MAG: type II toxin-antitoxin system VapC family toxin [Candidatus Solibacter sp.]|nr:type II toxin-antitoxin system VapC family toxin [Candidatus Solibacter sp.]
MRNETGRGAAAQRGAGIGHRFGSAAGDSPPLHRHRPARETRAGISGTFDMADDVLAAEKADVLRAAEIARSRALYSARDAVPIALMEHHGVQSVLSFDADFARWPGLKRIHGI